MVTRYVRDKDLIGHELKVTRRGLKDVQRATGTEQARTMDTAIEAGGNAQLAFDKAVQATADALDAKETVDGKNSIFVGVDEPTPAKPLVNSDLWYVVDSEGRMTGVNMWNGSGWVDYQIVADSLLVPGSVGSTLIEDGSIVTQKLAAHAIDFIEANGLQLYSSYIEAPVIASSDKLGSGANKLADPEFDSALDSVWVASGHLGDPVTTQLDHITWNQTWNMPDFYPPGPHLYRNKGDVEAVLTLTPGARATGSLVFANYSWLNTATRNISDPYTFKDFGSNDFFHGQSGGQYDPSFDDVEKRAPKTPTARTTYVTNTTPISVAPDTRWNVQLRLHKLSENEVANITEASVELIDSTSSAVLWSHPIGGTELQAGLVNAWWDCSITATILYRIKITYTAAGGGTKDAKGTIFRKVTPDSTATRNDASGILESWSGSGPNKWLDYGLSPSYTDNEIWQEPYKELSHLAVEATSALFAEVEPEKGWRLSADEGLEFFNSLGSRTARMDGEDNYFSGRLASSDSGDRWELIDTDINLYDNTDSLVMSISGSPDGLQFTGPVKFQGDTDGRIALPGNKAAGTTDYAEMQIINGIVYIDLKITATITTGTFIIWENVPVQYRPKYNTGAMSHVGGGYAGMMQIRTNGDIVVLQQTGQSRTYAESTLIYPLYP